MSLLILLFTSIDILYSSSPSDWMLLSSNDIARILDLYFPPEVIRNIDINQYIYLGNAIINHYEAQSAVILLSVTILMFL
jgi:hypothetical protein